MATVFKRGGKANRGGKYYISYFDHEGKRITRSARTSDKAVAERIAAKLEADIALRRDGVIDPHLDAICDESRRSVESHLADFEAKMQAGNRKPKHITTTIGYIRAIAKAAEWTTVSDISADDVNRWAGKLKEEGRSARTIQANLTAVKSFTRWLANHYKLPRDPLASVQKPDPKADRRRERRMLLPEEWDWLRSAAADGPEWGVMTGQERVLLYAVAIQTGLRASELRSLTRGRLFLGEASPFITCKAGSTKNAKDARQYIQRDLADNLARYVKSKTPGAAIFTMPRSENVADMLRADLASARRDWLKAAKHDPDEYERRMQSDFLTEKNHEGEMLDFHSLRHTCGAWLAMKGAHPKAIQAVMRHSTITLTMDTYGHLFPGQEADTVARLPKMLGNGEEMLRATGTADYTADDAQRQAQQSECKTVRVCAKRSEGKADAGGDSDSRKLLLDTKQRNAPQESAKRCANTPRRTRTSDPLIKSRCLNRSVTCHNALSCNMLVSMAIPLAPVFVSISLSKKLAMVFGPTNRFCAQPSRYSELPRLGNHGGILAIWSFFASRNR